MSRSVFFVLLTILTAAWAVIGHRVNKRIEVVSKRIDDHIDKSPAVFKDGQIFDPWESTTTVPSAGGITALNGVTSVAHPAQQYSDDPVRITSQTISDKNIDALDKRVKALENALRRYKWMK